MTAVKSSSGTDQTASPTTAAMPLKAAFAPLTRVLYAAVAAATLIFAAEFMVRRRITAVAQELIGRDAPNTTEVDRLIRRGDLLASVGPALLAVSALLMMTWLFWACRSDRAPGFAWWPGWAYLAWIVPLFNWVVPYLLVSQTYAASQRRLGRAAPAQALGGVGAIWWACWVCLNLLTSAQSFAGFGRSFDGAPDDYYTAMADYSRLTMLRAGFGVFSGVCCLLVIAKVSRSLLTPTPTPVETEDQPVAPDLG